MMKICSQCGIEKFIDDFSLNSHSKDGHRSSRKECRNSKIIAKSKRYLFIESTLRFATLKIEKVMLATLESQFGAGQDEKFQEFTEEFFDRLNQELPQRE
jgi:hypothetical protein